VFKGEDVLVFLGGHWREGKICKIIDDDKFRVKYTMTSSWYWRRQTTDMSVVVNFNSHLWKRDPLREERRKREAAEKKIREEKERRDREEQERLFPPPPEKKEEYSPPPVYAKRTTPKYGCFFFVILFWLISISF